MKTTNLSHFYTPVWKTWSFMWSRCIGGRAYARWFSLNISENIWCILISSPNLVRSTRASLRPSSNWVTLFSRSQRSFKATTMKDGWPWPHFQGHEGQLKWFLLNIRRNVLGTLTKFGTQRSEGKAKTKFESCDLDLIFKVTNII